MDTIFTNLSHYLIILTIFNFLKGTAFFIILTRFDLFLFMGEQVVMLWSFLVHFCSIFGPFLMQFMSIFDQSLVHFWAIFFQFLSPYLIHYESILGLLVLILTMFWLFWNNFDSFWPSCCPHCLFCSLRKSFYGKILWNQVHY